MSIFGTCYDGTEKQGFCCVADEKSWGITIKSVDLTGTSESDTLSFVYETHMLREGSSSARYGNLHGGDGNDILTGSDSTSSGYFDALWGGNHSDTIHGGAGDDKIFGNGGDDFLYGDAGNDELRGGFQNDTIFGGTGNDVVHGGPGNDPHLTGGIVNPPLTGGDSIYDVVYGDNGYDTIDCRGGDCIGGNGNDVLDATGSNDLPVRLHGGPGRDTLLGGSKSDVLYGGVGADFLNGGHQSDVLCENSRRTATTFLSNTNADFQSIYGGTLSNYWTDTLSYLDANHPILLDGGEDIKEITTDVQHAPSMDFNELLFQPSGTLGVGTELSECAQIRADYGLW